MHITRLHYSNSIPEVIQLGIPDEDVLIHHDQLCGVFDGVTLEHQTPYPNPSPATKAASFAAAAACATYQQAEMFDTDLIAAMFQSANTAINEYNLSLGITPSTVNHLDRQYAAAVGALGFVADGIFTYGQLNDCGIMVIDKTLQPKVIQVADTSLYDRYVDQVRSLGQFDPDGPDEYVHIRQELVNNSSIRINNTPIDFGVLTGEQGAEQFVKSGSLRITDGDMAVLYSDGFIPFLNDKTVVATLHSRDINQAKKLIESLMPKGPKFQLEKSLMCMHF